MSTQVGPGSFSRSKIEADRRRRVLQVAKSLSATLGADFFRSVVRHLAAAFHADRGYLGELTAAPSDRIRTLAVFEKRHMAENFVEKLAGTAAGQVMADGVLLCSKDVLRIFPEDEQLENIRAEAYAGIRLRDPAGQPIGLLAIVSSRQILDIQLVKAMLETFAPRTAAELDRKRADDMHRENEERYHAFVSTNPDAMWRIEFEQPLPLNVPEDEQLDRLYRFGYLAECNQALAKLAGQSTEQLTGARLDVFAPRDDAAVVEELRSAIRCGFTATSLETTIRDEGGHQLHRLRSQFGIVENGRLRRIWGTGRDVTDLRRAELSVAAAERRSREVLEGIPLLAVILDPQGAIIFCNDFFARLTQRSKSQLAQVKWLDGIISTSESEVWKAAMLAKGSRTSATSHFEGAILSRDGDPRPVQWDTICLRNQDDELTALAAIGRDLTHQKALETQVREAQKLDGIGRLAAGVAHDFNNLLTVVLGHAEQLLEQVPGTDPARPHVSEIRLAANMCIKLTGQLLAFSRRQRLQPEHLSLNDVVVAQDAIVRALIGKEVELVIELGASPSIVYADQTQIERILANLATNARDAMPLGGTLTLATSNLTVREEDAAYPGIESGPYVRLSVTDTGVGLSDAVRTHLFEPLFTTKEPGKGTGLGLATVYGIVTQSGGYIAVVSELGKGTTFDILLPAQTSNA